MNAPPNVEAPQTCLQQAEARKGQGSSTEIFADLMERDKRFSHLAACLALRGFALSPLTCGGFLIHRYDRTAYAPDYRAVAGFLGALQ
jgi:hypothetical protein